MSKAVTAITLSDNLAIGAVDTCAILANKLEEDYPGRFSDEETINSAREALMLVVKKESDFILNATRYSEAQEGISEGATFLLFDAAELVNEDNSEMADIYKSMEILRK